VSKVTSKLQITLPKRLADQYGIAPGDEITFEAAGEVIRLVPHGRQAPGTLSREERLRLFDAAMDRQRERERHMTLPVEPSAERGWRREDLYTRGKPD
jgi:AbrB family looped-hinge helix DNA binding protein